MAQGYNKLIKKSDGYEYMISPFAPVNLPLLDKNQIDINNQTNEQANLDKALEGTVAGKRTYKKREAPILDKIPTSNVQG